MELICLMSSRILLDLFKGLRIAGQVVGVLPFSCISRIYFACMLDYHELVQVATCLTSI